MAARRYIYILMLCVAMLFEGCHGGDVAPMPDQLLETFAASRGDKALWMEGDELGVAMLGEDGVIEGDNVPYIAYTAGSMADFVASRPLCYPTSGEARFVAYYPYDRGAEGVERLSVDVEGMESNILVAGVESCRSGDPLCFAFEPLLSRVEIHIRSASGYDSELLRDLRLTLGGISTRASYDLTTGEFELDESRSAVLSDEDGDNIYTMMLIPQPSAAAAMNFESSSSTRSYDMNVNSIESGKVYSYSATLSDSGVEFESLSILPWGDGGAQSGVAKADPPEGYTAIYTAEDYRKYFSTNAEVSGSYILMADIDLGSNWYMISKVNAGGLFDGNGHAVTYQMSTILGGCDYSLVINNHGTIQNLTTRGTLKYSAGSSGARLSGVVRTNCSGGVIRNCINEVDISGSLLYAGGIVMESEEGSSIYNCANWGDINNTTSSTEGATGGIVADFKGGAAKNLYNVGTITTNHADVICGNIIGRFSDIYDYSIDYIYASDDHIGKGAPTIENQQTYTKEWMQNPLFKTELDSAAAAIKVSDTAAGALASWIYNEGGYPTLNSYVAPTDTDIDVDYEPDGSAELPYVILAAEDLQTLSAEVASGDDKSGVHYVIARDLSLSTLLAEWLPIGTKESPFCGNLKSVKAESRKRITLAIANGTQQVNGLFGYVGSGAVIENVEVSGSIVGNYHLGALAAYNSGIIRNCTTSASVTTQGAYSVVGGLVGENCEGGEVRDCNNRGTVSEEGAHVTIGTLIGVNRGAQSGLTSTNSPETMGYETITDGIIGEEQ